MSWRAGRLLARGVRLPCSTRVRRCKSHTRHETRNGHRRRDFQKVLHILFTPFLKVSPRVGCTLLTSRGVIPTGSRLVQLLVFFGDMLQIMLSNNAPAL